MSARGHTQGGCSKRLRPSGLHVPKERHLTHTHTHPFLQAPWLRCTRPHLLQRQRQRLWLWLWRWWRICPRCRCCAPCSSWMATTRSRNTGTTPCAVGRPVRASSYPSLLPPAPTRFDCRLHVALIGELLLPRLVHMHDTLHMVPREKHYCWACPGLEGCYTAGPPGLGAQQSS